jgi:hypothetical protein
MKSQDLYKRQIILSVPQKEIDTKHENAKAIVYTNPELTLTRESCWWQQRLSTRLHVLPSI